MRIRFLCGLAAPLLAGAVGAVGCGGGGPASGEVGATSQADTTLPSTFDETPNPKPSDWKGTAVDLLVADALAQCATAADGSALSVTDVDLTDKHATSVVAQMKSTCAASPRANGIASPFAAWRAKRGDVACYTAPAGQTATGVTLDASTRIASYGLLADAAVSVRTAAVNYCVAQRLRSAAPGASAQQALSMPLRDQQQLLQVVHERAQIAMLQYGLLGLAFTSPSRPTGLVKSLGLQTDAGRMRVWAESTIAAATKDGTLGTDPLSVMGKDFAGVIELDLAATQELAELFSHQAAADEAAAGPNLSVADAVWGKGSWRQRLMGLLYGGDALQGKAAGVVGDDKFPGVDNTAVFPRNAALPGLDNPTELDWPTRAELPYAQTSATDPHTVVLLGLAQQLDVLDLKEAPGALCRGTDIAGSAKRLYRAVEAALRFKDCDVSGAAACPTAPDAASLPDETTSYSSYTLFKKHKILPSHATQLVTHLDDLIGDDCGTKWVEGARVGALDVGGSVTPRTLDGALYRHVTGIPGSGLRSAQFAPRVLEETAPLFARLGRFRMPRVIEYAAPLDQQGLVSGQYFNHAERKRALGAAEAFAATREALESAAMQGTPAGEAFLKLHQEIASALSAAIGDSAVAIAAHEQIQILGKPATLFGPNVSPRQPAILAQTVAGQIVTAPSASAALDWDVDVTFPPSDEFWTSAAPDAYTLVAIPKDPHAATLARFTGSARDGKTLDSLIASGYASTRPPSPDASSAAATDGLLRWHFVVALPRDTRWTFLARRKDTGATRLLAANVTLASFSETCGTDDGTAPGKHSYYTATAPSVARPLDGQYLAFGGELGMMALRTLAPDTVDPTLPGFDGFGLSRHFVPPPDPRVLEAGASGASAQTLVDYHLTLAKSMSDDAQHAVQRVLDNLLKIATDDAAGKAAAERSRDTINGEWGTLCGNPAQGTTAPTDPAHGNAQTPLCDKEMEAFHVDYAQAFLAQVRAANPAFDPEGTNADGSPVCSETIDLSIPKDPSLPEDWWKKYTPSITDPDLTKVPSPPIAEKQALLSTWLDCSTYRLLKALSLDTKIARAVRIANATSGGSDAAPAFAQVEGGKLATAFRAEWAAFDQAKQVVKQVTMANAASKQHLTSFVAAFQAVQGKAAKNCSVQAMGDSALAGLSVGVSAGFASATASVNMSMGPIVAQGQKCNDLKGDIDASAQQALSNMWDMMTATVAQASKLSDAGRAIQDSASEIAQLLNQANIAASRAALEEKLAKDTLQTSFGLWRSIHNQDVHQAQLSLLSARKQALIARRAIEASYVVDLSKMYANEYFVPAPKSWANDVYTMDLDMAAAAGLTVGANSPSSIYYYALSDYVTNLKQFRDGFFDTRPILHPDPRTFVVSLAAPWQTDPTDVVSWSFFCPNAGGTGGTWMDVPPAADQDTWALRLGAACARPILQAKVRFSLDPWGQPGILAQNPSLTKQFNMRWDKFFVNLKGTSVCDPSRMTNPNDSCVTTQYVRSNLTQVAPAWTTDVNGAWTPLGFVGATLQDVYALQLGATFGLNAWNDPIQGSYVAAAARHGLTDRPMGGFYELELNAARPDASLDEAPPDPAFMLSRLDGVQLVYMATYWQQP